MLAMTNQNGDWIEVSNGSPFWVLDTSNPTFKEAFIEQFGEDTEVTDVDKFENWVEEYGKPIRLWIDGGKLGFHN
jgi:hypothetical protein